MIWLFREVYPVFPENYSENGFLGNFENGCCNCGIQLEVPTGTAVFATEPAYISEIRLKKKYQAFKTLGLTNFLILKTNHPVSPYFIYANIDPNSSLKVGSYIPKGTYLGKVLYNSALSKSILHFGMFKAKKFKVIKDPLHNYSNDIINPLKYLNDILYESLLEKSKKKIDRSQLRPGMIVYNSVNLRELSYFKQVLITEITITKTGNREIVIGGTYIQEDGYIGVLGELENFNKIELSFQQEFRIPEKVFNFHPLLTHSSEDIRSAAQVAVKFYD